MTACGASDSGGGDDTVKIAYMEILTGPNTVDGATHAIELAVADVNKEGGIDGRKVELKTFDTDVTPEAATRATDLALKWQPDVVIGYPITAGLLSSVGKLKAAGIPVIHNTVSNLTTTEKLKYDRAFRLVPTTSQYAKAANSFLFNDLGVKSFTMIYTQDAGSAAGAEAVMADAKSQGVSYDERAIAPDATDITEAILTARKTDAIWSWGLATSDALTIKQAAQYDIKKPIMSFSASLAISNGLVPASIPTDNLYEVPNCGVVVSDSPKAKSVMAEYKKKYGVDLEVGLHPRDYDAVQLVKAAIEKAGSTDGKAIADAIRDVQFDGICGKIAVDDHNNLQGEVSIVSLAGGKQSLAQKVEVESDF